jgi:hypothetical protein
MKNLKLAAFLFISVLIISCKSQGTSGGKEGDSLKTEETSDVKESSKSGKYAMKSGIVEYNSSTMGVNVAQTLYFDDFGAKEAIETSMEVAGIKNNTVNINKDGYMYTLNMIAKTGTKQKIPAQANIDFNNLSDDIMKEMNLKKEGSEDFAGKKCDKYTIDNTKLQMKGSFLVWKGIALKSDLDFSSMKTQMMAKNIKEDASVPAEKFDIPADFKITEL